MLFRSNDTAPTEIYTGPYTLSLHDALPISPGRLVDARRNLAKRIARRTEHQPLAVRQAGRDVVRQIAEATMPISLHGDQCTASKPAMGTPEEP